MKTSGVTTLALKTIAATQARGEKVIYVDFAFTFNPKYASDCKVNIPDLLMVRPSNPLEGMEISTDLLQRYSAGLLVFGHAKHANGEERRAALRRLLNAVRRSSCAFVVLNRSSNLLVSPFHASTATRIQLRQIRWMHRWGIVHGYLSRATVTKLNGSDCDRFVTLRFDPPKPGERLQ
jgi:RecA/RadA recombinase